jgi:hypothetical protein
MWVYVASVQGNRILATFGFTPLRSLRLCVLGVIGSVGVVPDGR